MATQAILRRVAPAISITNHFSVMPIMLFFECDRKSLGLFKINFAIVESVKFRFVLLQRYDNFSKERYHSHQKAIEKILISW